MILNQLWNADLQMNIQKYEFDVEKTIFLEIIVSEQDLCMNSVKVKVIVNWTTFINLKKVQSFVDFINFYKCFIQNFFKIIKLFTQLIRKNISFIWNEIYVEVFTLLKEQINSILILHHFDFKRQIILKINAFNYVKKDVLSQYDDEDVLHLMIFYSKSMISVECNYHIYDKELLIIIKCFKHWQLELKIIKMLI